MKKVLVIAYFYPPMVRVGGRRWFLFVKYMRRSGLDVKVLTCEKAEDKGLDTTEIHYVKNPGRENLPYYKRVLPEDFLDKIRWHLSYWRDRRKASKLDHDYFDLSHPWTNGFLEKARDLIQTQQPDTVFLTVGPFSYSTILVDLKREFPHVKMVVDYRDDWFRDRPKLSARQSQGELLREREMLQAVDLITTVDSNITSLIRKAHPGLNTPILDIPHGYDADDFLGVPAFEEKPSNGGIKLIYGGACYLGVEKYYLNFRQLMEMNPGLTVDFYFTFLSDDVKSVLENFDRARFLPPVSRQEMLDIQRFQSDINLVFYPDTNHSARTSKFYELIKCGKPICYFGPDGDTARFIRANGLGLTFCNPEDLRKLHPDEIQSFKINLSVLEENSIGNIALRLMKAVENIDVLVGSQGEKASL